MNIVVVECENTEEGYDVAHRGTPSYQFRGWRASRHDISDNATMTATRNQGNLHFHWCGSCVARWAHRAIKCYRHYEQYCAGCSVH